jgi:hypothetical protein
MAGSPAIPNPTPIYRISHIDNLPVLLRRDALHAPNHVPDDGQVYRTIHDESVQANRHVTRVPCGPAGTVHDYVPFYFGPRSPMLLRLCTGRNIERVDQAHIVYLVSTVQSVLEAGRRFVFTDGHGLARFTTWFDDLRYLDRIDWPIVAAQWWNDTANQPDRQRRKQAEFLVHESMPWSLIEHIGVVDAAVRARVEAILADHRTVHRPSVVVRAAWYYSTRESTA